VIDSGIALSFAIESDVFVGSDTLWTVLKKKKKIFFVREQMKDVL
jgi:hypothetical protein